MTGPDGSDGLHSLGDIVGVDVDAILHVQLAVGGLQLSLPVKMGVQSRGDCCDDTGSGDSYSLSAHGSVLLDCLEVEIDPVSVLRSDGVVQDLADPLEVVFEIGNSTRSGEHSALDGLSFHGRTCRGGSGVDVVPYLQSHLGVGTVIGDHAVVLLLEEATLVHHGERVSTDLVPDRRGHQQLA